MRTLYYDNDYKIHVNNHDYTEFNTDFFDGKCNAFTEGHRYLPDGASYDMGNGITIYGEVILPWMDSGSLMLAQSAYEESQAVLNNTLTQIEEALGI